MLAVILGLASGAAGCKRPQGGQAASSTPAAGGPLGEARALIEAGQLDEALARLQSAPSGAEALYLQGVAWARKAEIAPLPTPPPPAPDAPRGAAAPRAPELKDEERRALELFDRAVQADAHLSAAELAAANLLAPHALRAFDQQALKRGKRPPRGPAAPSAAPAAGEPDWSVEGVLRRYQRAVQAESSGTVAVEALIAFATRVARLDDVDAAYRELIRRDHENAEPLVRYGDFLRDARGEPLRAVEQYQQALIWRPDDETTRAKLPDIYIELGIGHFQKREYMAAQVRFDEAAKYVKDPNSPQGLRLRDYVGRLREIRGGR
jgi:tetratricopeptide (TPR) repeat protein